MIGRACSIIPFLVAAAAGCGPGYTLARPDPAPIDPLLPPPASMSQVCVVRPAAAEPETILTVHDGKALMGATVAASFFCYFAVPGPHQIVSAQVGEKPRPPVDTAYLALPGQKYYFEQELAGAAQKLTLIDEAAAKTAFARATYRIVTAVPGGDKPPGRAPTAYGE